MADLLFHPLGRWSPRFGFRGGDEERGNPVLGLEFSFFGQEPMTDN